MFGCRRGACPIAGAALAVANPDEIKWRLFMLSKVYSIAGVLAVLPAKAGDGASTLAINLAGTAVREIGRAHV